MLKHRCDHEYFERRLADCDERIEYFKNLKKEIEAEWIEVKNRCLASTEEI